jgi:hypothetical protein
MARFPSRCADRPHGTIERIFTVLEPLQEVNNYSEEKTRWQCDNFARPDARDWRFRAKVCPRWMPEGTGSRDENASKQATRTSVPIQPEGSKFNRKGARAGFGKACPALDAGWKPVFRKNHAQTKS